MSTETLVRLPNWDARWYQEKVWKYLRSGGKRAVLAWHRRAGKDALALNWACTAANFHAVGGYWHMLPEAAQARKAIWAAVNPHTGKRLVDEAFPHACRETTLEHEMFIRFKNGSTWQVLGSDNFNSLVGSPPIGIVFSEYALANPAAWDILRPILLENGGTALFISTPRGDNHFKQLYDYAQSHRDGWFAERLTVDDTGIFTPEQLDNELAELQDRHGPDDGQALFDQEYRCSFVAPLIGAYYARLLEQAEKQGRIGSVPIIPGLPVHTAWDLGVGDLTAIWCFQVTRERLRFVDYMEASGQGIEYYCDWCDDRGYHGTDLLPHDAKQRVPVGNPPRTRIEIMLERQRKPQVVPLHSIPDGISAVRMMLPLCEFDAVKCAPGLRAARNYRRQWHEERKTFLDAPLHDWASHGSDALRAAAMGWNALPAPPPPSAPHVIDTRPPTWGELINEVEKGGRI